MNIILLCSGGSTFFSIWKASDFIKIHKSIESTYQKHIIVEIHLLIQRYLPSMLKEA